MKRNSLAVLMVILMAGGAAGIAMAQVHAAAATEPAEVSLLRIDMKKSLVEQDASPRVTAARAAKLKFLQESKAPAKDVASAEVDVIEAQTSEQAASLTGKSVEAQLNEAVKNEASIQPRQPASETEIKVLQIEAQKAKVQADGAARIAQNRVQVLALVQAGLKAGAANAGDVADAQADAEATKANAAILALEVEAANLRLDAAEKAVKK